MKKLDKLVITSFLGPFVLTYLVVVFILLTQYMLRYFDDIVGKDLGAWVIAKLFFFMSVNMAPDAIPLAVLLSALMTFGNLGEHSELTSIKASGISLLRIMGSIFIFSVLLCFVAYFNNNYIVPKANLEAFSLLYDIKQKKPSMELKEGTFYNGLSNYSIKVNKKSSDGEGLKDIIVYEHTGGPGNNVVTIADSGRMYKAHHDRYLVLELYNGNRYEQQTKKMKRRVNAEEPAPYTRISFVMSKIMFSLDEFELGDTDKNLFANNRIMMNRTQLTEKIDTMEVMLNAKKREGEIQAVNYFDLHKKEHLRDVFIKKDRLAEQIEEVGENGDSQVSKNFNEREQDKGPALKKVEKAESRSKNKGKSPKPSKEKNNLEKLENKKNILSGNSMAMAKIKDAKNNEVLAGQQNNDSARKALSVKIENAHNLNMKDSMEKVIRKAQKLAIAQNPQIKPSKKEMADNNDTIDDGAIEGDTLFALEGEDTVNYIACDSTLMADSAMAEVEKDTIDAIALIKDKINMPETVERSYERALNQVRYIKSDLQQRIEKIKSEQREINRYKIEKYNKVSKALTIIIMFLIGSPLGSIIKKGGLGLPVLLSIIFYIILYVVSALSDKWSRQNYIDPLMASWMANIVLLPAGLFFLKQARKDARLFEMDFYSVMFLKLKERIAALGLKKKKMANN